MFVEANLGQVFYGFLYRGANPRAGRALVARAGNLRRCTVGDKIRRGCR